MIQIGNYTLVEVGLRGAASQKSDTKEKRAEEEEEEVWRGKERKSGGSLEITDSAREFRKRGMEWGEEEEGEKGLQHQQANQRPQALLSEFVDRLSVDISEKGGTG